MSTHGKMDSVSSLERGIKLLETSALNKGTAFTDAERASFGLDSNFSRKKPRLQHNDNSE
jgi:hypothetical protein